MLKLRINSVSAFSYSLQSLPGKALKSYAIMAWTPFNVCCGRHGTVMISAPYIPSAGCNLLGEAALHRAETSEAVTES